MWFELLMAAGTWLFKLLISSADTKAKKLALTKKWLEVLDDDFLSSVKVSNAFKKMWESAKNEPWSETGGPGNDGTTHSDE